MLKKSLGAPALLALACVPAFAPASEPASHAITVAPTPGESVVVEWTGTALPGASGIGTTGSLGDAPQPCPPAGPDDAHALSIASDGTYEAVAHVRVEWTEGPELGLSRDPDLVLAVYQDTTDLKGYSDGGAPEENVSFTVTESGEFNAIVCPFQATQPTPYRATLTLTTLVPKACFAEKGRTISNGSPLPGSASAANLPGLPNFDLFSAEMTRVDQRVPTDAHGRLNSSIFDRALGLPTFLWARTDAPVAAVGALSERELLVERARSHLRDEAKELRLDAAAIDDARVFDAQFNGDGPAVVRFRQQVAGLEVFQRALSVMLDRNYRPQAVSGYFATARAPLGAFDVAAPAAIAASWATLGGYLDPASLQPAEVRGAWQRFEMPALSGSHTMEREPRARQVWYARPKGLEPAWQVELFANARVNGNLIAYSFVVSALDGRVLHRTDLKAHAAYTYRVFGDGKDPHPYDSPVGNEYVPFPGLVVRKRTPTNLITLDHAGIKTGDPWLADDATTTSGNNVRACIDTYDHPVDSLVNLGEVGGIRQNDCLAPLEPSPEMTADRTFDYPIETDENPANENAKNAAAVNLFYVINWHHDWWYNHGFDEAAGNAQVSNFGRGGEEGDPILAQGQDGSGSNNANMATPADGSSPVMQQYLFDGKAPPGEVRVVAPVEGEPIYWVGAAFGPQTYDIPPTVVALADDGVGSPTDGCGEPIPFPTDVFEDIDEQGGGTVPVPTTYQPVPAPPQASLAGKIVLVDRGGCNNAAKEKFAMSSGAVAMIVMNDVDDPPTIMGGDIPIYATALGPRYPQDAAYLPPAVMIPKADGEALKALVAAGEVQMQMSRGAVVKLDGTLDNTIIAHEFFHYVHHRLTDSSSAQTSAMSEGWGDINGFMMSLRGNDLGAPGNDRLGGGAYALAGYVYNDFYHGIRRNPYTTDMTKNAFTFKEIQNDPGAHAAGEIWAEMMFECYAGLLTGPGGFEATRSRMKDYIVAGFKMTPANATYVEARDAVLSAVLATDFEDFKRCSAGFAKRGMGLKAVAPERSSSTFEGLVEDYTPFVCDVSPRAGEFGEAPEGDGVVLGGSLGGSLLLPLLGLGLLRRRRR